MSNIRKKETIIKCILTFIIYFSSPYLKLSIIKILNINIKTITTLEYSIIGLISTIIITILLLILYRKELIAEFKIFKNDISTNLDIGFKYWTIGIAIMAGSNFIINFFAGQANNEEAIQNMISIAPFLVLISAGLLAPIVEEITFRKAFKNIFNNKIIYIIVSGLIFGYLHVLTADSLQQFLYIIPYSSLGICFAICYCKTDTIFTSMSMHMMHNLLLTIISIIRLFL